MTALLAIPEPQSVDLERAHNLAQQITEWAGFRQMAEHQEVPEVAEAIEKGHSRSEVLILLLVADLRAIDHNIDRVLSDSRRRYPL